MSEQINVNCSHARRFTATIDQSGRFVFQAPLNYQVVAQNIRAADVLRQHDNVNSVPLEPQHRGLPHVVDLSTARRRLIAQRRLNTQRQQALRRAVESEETRAVRLQNKAAHNAATLAVQNDEARAVRLQNMAANNAATRAAENDEARAVRLQNMAAHNAATLAAQNDEARAVRLQNMAANNAATRAAENDEARAVRLQNMAANNAATRAAENDEARAVRLQNMAAHNAATLAGQNDEARAVRLQNMAARNAATRAAENDEAAAERRRNVARRVAARRADNLPFHNFARRDIFPDLNNIGPMTSVCEHCLALKFEDEKSFKCCHGGKVSLANLEPYPQELSDLMLEDTAQGKNFRANIRQFNSAFSFASFGANIAPPPGRGPPCFRLCGQVVHRSGTLHPEHGFPPSYSQLYIYDGQRALDERMNRNENRNCHPDVMRTIQNVMHRDNPYALAFKHMSEVEQEEHLISAAENRLPSEVQMYMKVAGDRRRYNLPHHDEVAAVFVGEDGAPPTSRDIMVYPRNRYLETISTTSPNLDPMVYPSTP